MESFGVLLKKYIQSQGFTVYQIAKETGIDRSFLQGVLVGKRKLPQKRFSDIVNLSYFSPTQLNRLCDSYFLEKFGKEKVKRIRRIEYGILGKMKEELNIPFMTDEMPPRKGTQFLNGKNAIL